MIVSLEINSILIVLRSFIYVFENNNTKGIMIIPLWLFLMFKMIDGFIDLWFHVAGYFQIEDWDLFLNQ